MGKAAVCLLVTSVPVAILFYEIHLYVTFVLSLVLVALHWGAADKEIVLVALLWCAADKEIVLRFNKVLFPFAMWGNVIMDNTTPSCRFLLII
jgi:hypothetical protein